MNEIILTNDNGEQCITSMQIAFQTDKGGEPLCGYEIQ